MRRGRKLAGYAHPNKQGPRLLVNVGIRDAIEKRLNDVAMGANEVLTRLGGHARGDLSEFVGLTPEQLKKHPQAWLLKNSR